MEISRTNETSLNTSTSYLSDEHSDAQIEWTSLFQLFSFQLFQRSRLSIDIHQWEPAHFGARIYMFELLNTSVASSKPIIPQIQFSSDIH